MPAGEGHTACSGGKPGTYATAVAFQLGRRDGTSPAETATILAARLRRLDWVASVIVSGGYLTVAVTDDTLASMAVRITQAGPASARSGALRGTTLTAPRSAHLATARTWQEAHDRLARHLTGRLGVAAGAEVRWNDDDERLADTSPAASAGRRPVGEAIDFAGLDAVTFALCRLAPAAAVTVDPESAAAHHVRNPAYAVRYAHAHAASTLRQAADLGLDRTDAAGFQPRLLAHPSERALLGELSWLPERVGEAARRGRPDVLARYLEGVAAAYFACQESCPAVWPGMRSGRLPRAGGQAVPDEAGGQHVRAQKVPAASAEPAGSELACSGPLPPGSARPRPAAPGSARLGQGRSAQVASARLWLAEAAVTVLATGLSLLGVDAPARL